MTDIKEIKPDTSLYSDLPSRFRALALIAEAQNSGKTVQLKSRYQKNWSDGNWELFDRDSHYRIKPEPRVVWAIFDDDGSLAYARTELPKTLIKGQSFSRFVESPE